MGDQAGDGQRSTRRRTFSRRKLLRGATALAATGPLTGLLAACGGGDENSADATTATATTQVPEAESTSRTVPTAIDEPRITPSGEPAGEAGPTATSSEETATSTDSTAAFPVTIEHKYGSTTIVKTPERVVSVGYNDHDALLALGIVPVAVREWFGDQPFATWPWAEDELGNAEPEVLATGELDFERIAALQPDLIIGLYSGLTEDEYTTL